MYFSIPIRYNYFTLVYSLINMSNINEKSNFIGVEVPIGLVADSLDFIRNMNKHGLRKDRGSKLNEAEEYEA